MTIKEGLCKRIILSIFFLLVLCRTAGAQDARKAILSAADAGTCTANSTACSFLAVPSGSGGVTFTITTNASANTVQFEATGDTEPTGSHTWVALSVFPSNSTTSVTSTTSTGTWQANVAGFTQVRLRMSTFVGGTTTTYINLSTASARVGGGGGLPTGCTSPGTGAITCTGTVTADIGSFNSVGENFTDIACAAQSVGNSNQDRLSCDGTNWPVVSMNTNAAQKLALSMGVNAQTVSYLAVQSDCGKLITMNGVSLTFTLPATIINSACVFDVKNLAATSLTISRNGLNVDGAASNPTALTQNQSYRITNDGAGYWTEALQISAAAPVSSVFTRTGAVVAAANDYTLDQIGNPVASKTFQPTVDASVIFKQFNGTNAVDIFDVQDKGGTNKIAVDAGGTVRLSNGICSLSTGAFLCNEIAVAAGFGFRALEGAVPSVAAGSGYIYGDSTAHALKAISNGGGTELLAVIAPTPIHSTGNTAAITTATLCSTSAGNCDQAGNYTVEWVFTQTGTACGTPGAGGVTFLLTWTDSNGTAHSAISLAMDDSASLVATTGTFHFTTSNATAWASGQFNISSNGSILQYATGYTACGVGTGSYTLDAWAVRKR